MTAAFDDDAATRHIRNIGAAKATVACLVDREAWCTATATVAAVVVPAIAPVVVAVVVAVVDAAARTQFQGERLSRGRGNQTGQSDHGSDGGVNEELFHCFSPV